MFSLGTGERLISLKKYLDMDSKALASAATERDEPQPATLESFRAVIRAIGKSAAQACPAFGAGTPDRARQHCGISRRSRSSICQSVPPADDPT
jgi:hypothetical protein